MNSTRLTLCMIVKDEEDCIERCLNSVKNVVDEIIIVDTGSTDNTISICQKFNAKIVEFEWNDSFADSRNYGIDKATGDWIIWMDADEELDKNAKQIFFEGTHFDDFDVLTLHLVNYFGDQVDIHNTTEIAHTRLFRHNGIKFINKMHERLDTDTVSKERIGHLNVKIYHYGYLNPVVEKKGKSGRNLKLLQRQIEEGENIYWAYYFIALDYYNKQMYQDALEQVNLSLLAFLSNKVLPPSMVYKLKYSILIAMGRFENALEGIEKAITIYPDFVDLRFFKGLILYHLNNYVDAIESFKDCINLGEDNTDYLILKGVGTFQAWYYISLCQKQLNQYEEALESIMKSLLFAPQYKNSLNILDLFINENKICIDEFIVKHFNNENHETLSNIVRCIKQK